MTTFAYTYDTSVPDGQTQPVSCLDNYATNDKKANQERLNVDHKFDLTGTQVSDADTGKHRRIVFYTVLTEKPTLEDGECAFYSKEVEGVPEPFFETEDGTEKQLLSAGALNITLAEIAGLLTNDTYWTAIDEAGTGTVNLIKASRNEADDTDVALLPDETRLASSAAPTEDTQVVNKKYVDDNDEARCQLDGSVVFNTTLTDANTWQDLDLSAKVGANAALVFLEIKNAGGDKVYLKPKGHGGTPPNTYHQTESLGYADTASDAYMYTCMMTDSSGVIQIACSLGTSTTTIKLIGFVI